MFLLFDLVLAITPVQPSNADIAVPERVEPKKKPKLKGVEVPPGLEDHFDIQIEPAEKGSPMETMRAVDASAAALRQQVALHMQAMNAQTEIEPVRPVLLAGVLREDHAAALLDSYVPDHLTEDRIVAYRAARMKEALPECQAALERYRAAVVAATEVKHKAGLKAAKAGVVRMQPADDSVAARVEACNRAIDW